MDTKTSPIIKKGTAKTMTFPEAIFEVIKGKKITRLEWGTNASYGLLKDARLMIVIDGKIHQWIISDGDLKNNDWVVLPETN